MAVVVGARWLAPVERDTYRISPKISFSSSSLSLPFYVDFNVWQMSLGVGGCLVAGCVYVCVTVDEIFWSNSKTHSSTRLIWRWNCVVTKKMKCMWVCASLFAMLRMCCVLVLCIRVLSASRVNYLAIKFSGKVLLRPRLHLHHLSPFILAIWKHTHTQCSSLHHRHHPYIQTYITWFRCNVLLWPQIYMCKL